MTIKDILVGLATRQDADPARDYALKMASHYRAHVTGLAYALAPDVPFSVYPAFVSGLAEEYRAQANKVVAGVRARFEQAARAAAVEHGFETRTCSVQSAIADFAFRLRTADLGVVMQHKAEEMDSFGDMFLESALFQAGRPIVVVPREFQGPFSLDRVLIAWDASLHATRAVAAAAPLLTAGATIEVYTAEEASKGSSLRGSALVQNLRRHGLDAVLAERQDRDIPEAILREIESFRATLVVMGGYGHSRFRQFVFGGATRLMLSRMPVPVLMAH
ncbi:MAG: universal stress protein [Xanthobacteraceae bacterium]|nr:universal stress protein [Xanthobacteraceae bacterium]